MRRQRAVGTRAVWAAVLSVLFVLVGCALASGSGDKSQFSALEAQVVNELMNAAKVTGANVQDLHENPSSRAPVVVVNDGLQPAKSIKEAGEGLKTAASNRAQAEDKDKGLHEVSSSTFGSLGPLVTKAAASGSDGIGEAISSAFSDDAGKDDGRDHNKSVFDSGHKETAADDGKEKLVSVARATVGATATNAGAAIKDEDDSSSSGGSESSNGNSSGSGSNGRYDDGGDDGGVDHWSAQSAGPSSGGRKKAEIVESLAMSAGKAAATTDEDGNLKSNGDYEDGGESGGGHRAYSAHIRGNPRQVYRAKVPDDFKMDDPFNSRLTNHLGGIGAPFPSTEAEARYAAMAGYTPFLGPAGPVEDDPVVIEAKMELMRNLAAAQSRLRDAITAQYQAQILSEVEAQQLLGSVDAMAAAAANGTNDEIIATDLAAARLAAEISSGDAEQLTAMSKAAFEAIFEDAKQQAMDQLEDSEKYEEALEDDGEVDCKRILTDTYNKIPTGVADVDLKEARASLVPRDTECTEIRSCVMETKECSADARSCVEKQTTEQTSCSEIQKCVRYLGCKVTVIQDHIVSLINKSLKEKAHATRLKQDAAAQKVKNNMLKEQMAQAEVSGQVEKATQEERIADEKEQQAQLEAMRATWSEENEQNVIAQLTDKYKKFESGLEAATKRDISKHEGEIKEVEAQAKTKLENAKEEEEKEDSEKKRLQARVDRLEREKVLTKKKADEEKERLKKMKEDAERERKKAEDAARRMSQEKETIRLRAIREKEKAEEAIHQAKERKEQAERKMEELRKKKEEEIQRMKDEYSALHAQYTKRIDQARSKIDEAKEVEVVSEAKISAAKQKQADLLLMSATKQEAAEQLAAEREKLKKAMEDEKAAKAKENKALLESNYKLKLAYKRLQNKLKHNEVAGGQVELPSRLKAYLHGMVNDADAALKTTTEVVAKTGGPSEVPEDLKDLQAIRKAHLADEEAKEEAKLDGMKKDGATDEDIKKEADQFADSVAATGEDMASAEADIAASEVAKEALAAAEGDGADEPDEEAEAVECGKPKHKKHPKCKK